MTSQEIKEGIKLICQTSIDVQGYYEDKQKLVDALNGVPKLELDKCWEYYKNRSGVIVNVRKELLKKLIENNIITVGFLDQLVDTHKKGRENQFRVYKNYYTIFYPIITFFGHNPQRDFINQFITEFVNDLEINNNIKTVSFDFQGARQQGSDRYWLAIFNKEQQNQSTGLQFFIEFWHGKIGYGIHRHSDNSYLKPRSVLDSESFIYKDMLNYFKSEVEILLNDKPKYENLNTINLQGNSLYKISHGSFKAKKNSHVVDYLKQNSWIILHENTGKDQSEHFKTKLKKGDYVYITLGSKELIGIAKVASEEWEYVPEEIVDSLGWMFREVEFIKAPVRKKPRDLKETKNIFPSGNSTLTEIKPDALVEANAKLFKPYFNIEFIRDLGRTVTNDKAIMNKISLNQILYGPPGTGKTYNTVLEAAKIVTGNRHITYDEALKEFNNNLGNQIEFITFHQSYSYEDFIQGIRPDTDNGKELSFEKKDGIFKRIADRALKNLSDTEKPESAKKDFDIVFRDFITPINEEEEIEVKMKKTSFYITQVSEKSIEFRKNQGDSQHTLSINTLRKMYNSGVNDIILGGLQPYYNPILKVLLEKGKSQFEPFEKKNYVIIIDEINRANISRVFGELITLIEDDKRSHGKIPMQVTLPSGDTFIVPSNLYIIGTMNTADKSIALLDIALRRRFDFIPMYPLYNGLEEKVNDADKLQNINEAILSRKNHDFMIGHAYFMGKEYSLEKTINKKVIPLLLEYFMNDEKEVATILQSAGIKIGGWPLKMQS